MARPHPYPITVEEFLAWEREQEERYELVGGVIVGMVGATADHNSLVGTLQALLRPAVRARGCRVFQEGMKVVAGNDIYYPDVVVTCAEVAAKDDRVQEPLLIVEVLSPTTESRDRGQKWLAYQAIPSLQHYLLVSQDALRVEDYGREAGGWRFSVLDGPAARVRLPEIGIELDLEEIYADTSLRSPP